MGWISGLFQRQQSENGAVFRVKIELHQAETRYMYSWTLIAARKRPTRQERLALDHKVAAYVRHLNEVPPASVGTKTVEAWL